MWWVHSIPEGVGSGSGGPTTATASRRRPEATSEAWRWGGREGGAAASPTPEFSTTASTVMTPEVSRLARRPPVLWSRRGTSPAFHAAPANRSAVTRALGCVKCLGLEAWASRRARSGRRPHAIAACLSGRVRCHQRCLRSAARRAARSSSRRGRRERPGPRIGRCPVQPRPRSAARPPAPSAC